MRVLNAVAVVIRSALFPSVTTYPSATTYPGSGEYLTATPA